MNQIAAAIAGNPNIIVGKNPAWNVPEGLISFPIVAGAFRNIMISPSCPPHEPPTDVNHNGVLITWCNPNGIRSLLRTPNPPMIPAFAQ